VARIINPTLIADLITRLNIQGELAPFDISQVAVPIFDIGSLGGLLPQEVVTPSLSSTVRVSTLGPSTFLNVGPTTMSPADDLVTDLSTNPNDGDVLADTGQLAAVRIVINAWCSPSGTSRTEFVHRNAANDADLGIWNFSLSNGSFGKVGPIAVVPLLNERFIWRQNSNLTGTMTTNIEFPAASPSTEA